MMKYPLIHEQLRRHTMTEVRDALEMAPNVGILIQALQDIRRTGGPGTSGMALEAIREWDAARKKSREERQVMVFPRGV